MSASTMSAIDFSRLPARQAFTTSRNYSYSLISVPAEITNPTLLLLHGWPSHADDWIHQITYLSQRGYGLVVPDLLGYGASSTPTNPSEYKLRLLSADLVELLDHLGLEKVVGVGHDWGANVLSRLLVFHPARISALAFLGIGPSSPGTAFHLDAINEQTRQMVGYELCGYIDYMARDSLAAEKMAQNAGSVMSVMFAGDQKKAWRESLHPLGGFKGFVESGERVEVAGWYTEELQRRHMQVFARKGGYEGAVCYYKMMVENLSIGDEDKFKGFEINVPSALIISEGSQMQIGMLKAWAPQLRAIEVDAGHWVQIECGEETNRVIEDLIMGL
jgi:soluble epoxide hydrolase / lipid-phosphate phosphatase